MTKTIASTKNYPKGVFVMFTLQALGMVGFILIFALLVLDLTKQLGFNDSAAYAIAAAFNALVFSISIVGGYLAERFIGYRLGTIYSIIVKVIGLCLLAIQTKWALYAGLAAFIIGTGIWVPCTYVLLGRLYNKDDSRRDSGFTMAYVGMNVGAFFAASFAGPIQTYIGFSTAFIFGAFITFLSLIYFLAYQKFFINPHTKQMEKQYIHTAKTKIFGLILATLCIPIISILIDYATICNIALITAGIVCIFFIIYIALREPAASRKRLFAFLILTLLSIGFWALYTLSPSVIIMFTEHNVDRHIFNWIFPTASITIFNPFFIVTLGPLLGAYWIYRSRIGKTVSTAEKFAWGTALMGIGYLVLVLGIYFHTPLGFTLLMWIFFSYLFQTSGELLIAPIGFSMVGNLVPERFEGLMMGIWTLAIGIAGSLSEFLAQMTVAPEGQHNPLITSAIYSHSFAVYGCGAIIISMIGLMLVPYLKRMSGQAIVTTVETQFIAS